ncbi:MAG: hypothetical protein L0H41_05810 [Microlunatus sp.]|nr:hypothetical protein [Microlunatus sp.]MDN5771079.1 hypothetical protein [Microlunatus sp.]MDN5803415.1 hypothetical protein [Microlunatus sp.]
MFTSAIAATVALLVIIAIAQLLSIVSRAWIPAMLTAILLFLILMWIGVVPPELVKNSGFSAIAAIIVPATIVHMGTMIPLTRIREQWKGIVIGVAGVIGIVGLVIAIVTVVYDYETAVAGAGTAAGGIIAFLITSSALEQIGRPDLIVIPALVLAIQSLVGMPIANTMLRKYVVKQRAAGGYAAAVPALVGHAQLAETSAAKVEIQDPEAVGLDENITESAPTRLGRSLIPERYQESTVLIALVFAFAWIAIVLGDLTGINAGVWALVVGVVGHAAGILPSSTLFKANAFGFFMPIIIMVVLASMSTASWGLVVASFVPAMVVIAAAVIGIVLFAGFASRVIGWDPLKGMPVGLTALFGFPADYMLCQEISRSVGADEREEEAIMNDIYTPMLIGGFTTVTLSSVVVASILVSTLT